MSGGNPSLIQTGIWVGIVTLVIVCGWLFRKWEARHATRTPKNNKYSLKP